MDRPNHWITRVADRVEKRVLRDPEKGEGATIVCASGVSPSGPIHLGNLREVMTVHLVTEELRLRGRNAVHIHSWDDFDRLRKVPAGVPPGFAEHVGRPLADIPDPSGEYESYAARHRGEFEAAAARLGVAPRYIRQSQAYRAGTYLDLVKKAMAERERIFDILAQFQDPERHEAPAELRRSTYYPFRVYCETCHRDTTVIEAWAEPTAFLEYRCVQCGHRGAFSLDDKVEGKLVWKVDWPMRWTFEQVDFEPGGEDHSSPGSSYDVGQRIAREIFGRPAPDYVGYAFVGIAGRSKISSSAGTSATPRAALDILEPAMVRWLYIRRDPGQSFAIDFGQEVVRLYDEWDTFRNRASTGKASPAEAYVHQLCIRTSAGAVQHTEGAVPFRLLSSAADLTQSNRPQILRIVSQHLGNSQPPPSPEELAERLEPRLTCAIHWVEDYFPDDERTKVKPAFDTASYEALREEEKRAVGLLLERLDEPSWSLEGLTRLVYGVPKLVHGLDLDAPPTPEIKEAQRRFFIALYTLLVGSDTGPRLPTLFLSLGLERVRELLGGSR